MNLKQLINEVQKKFGKRPSGVTYLWSLGPIYGIWRFNVTDDWHKWLDNEYSIDFIGDTPEKAIKNFLDYIKKHKINPAKLRHEDSNFRR